MDKKLKNSLQTLKKRTNKVYVCGCMLWVWGVVNIISFHPVWTLPTYEQVAIEQTFNSPVLTQEDQELLFLQTGLGSLAVAKLREQEDGLSVALAAQAAVFGQYALVCEAVIPGLTGEDHLADAQGNVVLAPALIDPQPGDILVTLSPHSVGWHHGHAGLVMEGGLVLESFSLGVNSGLASMESWRRYSQYALLRVQNTTPEQCSEVVEVAQQWLVDTRYDLTVGLWGEKFVASPQEGFGTQCAYLPWYAWQSVGIDLDGNGGRLVLPQDLLASPEVEIVQMFGFDLQGYEASIFENRV